MDSRRSNRDSGHRVAEDTPHRAPNMQNKPNFRLFPGENEGPTERQSQSDRRDMAM